MLCSWHLRRFANAQKKSGAAVLQGLARSRLFDFPCSLHLAGGLEGPRFEPAGVHHER